MNRVENYPSLRQVSQGCYINVSDSEYQDALKRYENQQKLTKLEKKVDVLEGKLNTIITLLQENKHGTT